LGREALKAGLNLALDVMEGQNVTQAAKSKLKSTGQILLQKAIIGVGRPGERSIKRAGCFILDTTSFSFCSEVSPPRVLARMVF
jgi:hypothetical protein